MPRGIYDRSHLKAKRAAKKEGKVPGMVASPIAATSPMPKTTRVEKVQQEQQPDVLVCGSVDQLYRHLSSLTATRIGLSDQQANHNEELVGHLDREISDTVSSLRSWRESNFPSVQKAQKVATAVAPHPTIHPPTATPLPAPVPASIVPSSATPPPLPFTPQAVQEILKQQSAQ